MQLLEQAVDLEDAHVINRKRFDKVRWQRRFMAAVTFGTLLATVAFVVALATPSWAVIDFTNHDMHRVNVQLGVWGEWRTISNETSKTGMCVVHPPCWPFAQRAPCAVFVYDTRRVRESFASV